MQPEQVAMAAGAVVVIVGAGTAAAGRLRRPSIKLLPLSDADRARYTAAVEGLTPDLEGNPQLAASRARGMVEELLRRRGFPDRVDAAQKIRDVARRDAALGRLLGDADRELRADPATADTMRRAAEAYCQALGKILDL